TIGLPDFFSSRMTRAPAFRSAVAIRRFLSSLRSLCSLFAPTDQATRASTSSVPVVLIGVLLWFHRCSCRAGRSVPCTLAGRRSQQPAPAALPLGLLVAGDFRRYPPEGGVAREDQRLVLQLEALDQRLEQLRPRQQPFGLVHLAHRRQLALGFLALLVRQLA